MMFDWKSFSVCHVLCTKFTQFLSSYCIINCKWKIMLVFFWALIIWFAYHIKIVNFKLDPEKMSGAPLRDSFEPAVRNSKTEIHNTHLLHGGKCAYCGIYPIPEIRYKCKECDNYDLCQNCRWTSTHYLNHKFWKIQFLVSDADWGRYQHPSGSFLH